MVQPDGTGCDDGNAETFNDQCASGVCYGYCKSLYARCLLTTLCNFLQELVIDINFPSAISCPAPITITGLSAPAVTWDAPSITYPPYDVPAVYVSANSGDVFPVGVSLVNYNAVFQSTSLGCALSVLVVGKSLIHYTSHTY